ncbi:MAG: type VI secretion system baseplate subunit TssE [Phycisphaerae bacterium]|nr:type VI secretion system baseplate subunit TssE [Phycisphaerae bacterium]
MGRERTLLERLSEIGGGVRTAQTGTTIENLEEMLESVRGNLGRLLNSREGMCEASPDYGLPALTDITVGSADYLRRLLDGIRETIERYEPRLRNVRVSLREGESTQTKKVFRVEANLVSKSGEHRVWYDTAVRSSGRFEIEG